MLLLLISAICLAVVYRRPPRPAPTARQLEATIKRRAPFVWATKALCLVLASWLALGAL